MRPKRAQCHKTTFLLGALGEQADEAGLEVAWFTLEDLSRLLRRHRARPRA